MISLSPRFRSLRMLSVLGLLAGLAAPLSAASGGPTEPGEPARGPLTASGSTPSAASSAAGESAESAQGVHLRWDAALGRSDRRADLLHDDAWVVQPRRQPASVRPAPQRRALPTATIDLIELDLPRWEAPEDDDGDGDGARRSRTRVATQAATLQPDFRRKASPQVVDPRHPRRRLAKPRPQQRIRPKSWNLLLPRTEPRAPVTEGEGPVANDLPGGESRMEMHFGEDLSEGLLTTFVGGSQEEEDASATAFGRGIGAEAGLQYSQSESWAYRVLVARKFVNDLDAPSQSAKLSFEVNVRF